MSHLTLILLSLSAGLVGGVLAWCIDGHYRRKYGILSPRESAVIEREIREGTPDTPQRVETIRRADEVFKRSGLSGSGEGSTT